MSTFHHSFVVVLSSTCAFFYTFIFSCWLYSTPPPHDRHMLAVCISRCCVSVSATLSQTTALPHIKWWWRPRRMGAVKRCRLISFARKTRTLYASHASFHTQHDRRCCAPAFIVAYPRWQASGYIIRLHFNAFLSQIHFCICFYLGMG